MWALLRDRRLCGVKFRRQRPIGSFIVDFCCLERKLIIELDGGQHGEPSQAQADARRSRFLRAGGYRVLRFWDSDALNDPHSVLELIVQALRSETSVTLTLDPLSRKGAGEGKTEAGGLSSPLGNH